MKLGKFEIEPFIFYIAFFVLLILGVTYLSALPELQKEKTQQQESQEREVRYQMELEQTKLEMEKWKNEVSD